MIQQFIFAILIFLQMIIFTFKSVAEVFGVVGEQDLALSLEYLGREPSYGQFQLVDSFWRWEWLRSDRLALHLGIGSPEYSFKSNLFPREINVPLVLEQFSLESGTPLGVFKGGIQTVPFGYEGWVDEREHHFLPSFFLSERFWSRRDTGLSLRSHYKEYFAHLLISNGEGSENIDGRMFYTLQIGGQNSVGTGVLFSGQVGYTEPEATEDTTSEHVALDFTQSIKLRQGALTFFIKNKLQEIIFEITEGEWVQKNLRIPFSNGRVNWYHKMSSFSALLLGYEELDFNKNTSNDLHRLSTIGWEWRSELESESILLALQAREEQKDTQPNNQLVLRWKITNFR